MGWTAHPPLAEGWGCDILHILGPLSLQRNLCCDSVSLALCRDRVFRVVTGFLGQAHDPVWVRAINM